jgi:hypothetical protein
VTLIHHLRISVNTLRSALSKCPHPSNSSPSQPTTYPLSQPSGTPHSKNPDLTRLWNTPLTRQWWTDANLQDIQHKPFQRYIKVVDTNSLDPKGKPRIAAYAKWDLSTPEQRGEHYPPWPPDMPGECDAFFGRRGRGGGVWGVLSIIV